MDRKEIDTIWFKAMHESIKDGEEFTRYHFAAAIAAIEREACANKAGEFAQRWWSIHCASNKHMETTRKAHDDFCALQDAIRARGEA